MFEIKGKNKSGYYESFILNENRIREALGYARSNFRDGYSVKRYTQHYIEDCMHFKKAMGTSPLFNISDGNDKQLGVYSYKI